LFKTKPIKKKKKKKKKRKKKKKNNKPKHLFWNVTFNTCFVVHVTKKKKKKSNLNHIGEKLGTSSV